MLDVDAGLKGVKGLAPNKIKVLVFDWDGTIVDSEAHIVSCIGHAAQLMGLPELPYDIRKSIIGLGLREALLALYPDLDDDQILQMRGAYSEKFFQHLSSSMDLFEGVEDTLDLLKQSGYRLAVATGKSRNGLNKALANSGLQRFFDIERCADETKSKPHPLMLEEIAQHFQMPIDSMMMVGDTTYDLEMAKSIGMPSLGVSYGVHDIDVLRQCGPIAIIDRFKDIVRHIY